MSALTTGKPAETPGPCGPDESVSKSFSEARGCHLPSPLAYPHCKPNPSEKFLEVGALILPNTRAGLCVFHAPEGSKNQAALRDGKQSEGYFGTLVG
jgi:hypothetical protein